MKPKSTAHFLILNGIILLCLLQCASRDTEDESKNSSRNLQNATSTFLYNAIPPGAQAAVSVEYSTAINTFSVNLLKTVCSTSGYRDSNVILSPFSVSRNLAVLTEASSGQTRVELLNALGGQQALDDARAALAELLYADGSVIFQCADALWIDSTQYSILASFKDTAQFKFGVNISGLDFNNVDGATATINGWIDANTNHKISRVLDPADLSGSAAVLADAVYFEADWTSPFDITKTQAGEFKSPGGTVMVNMMESDFRHETRKTDAYENAVLYYGTNNKNYFYLDIYMPIAMSVEQFLQDSCLAILSRHGADSASVGAVKMPKFFFTTRCDLIPMLKTLGVNRVFDPLASEITNMVLNKSGINDPLYIEKVVHEAGIKTDEEGTEAYAVTVSVAGVGSAAPGSPDVEFDRPFVYFIRAGVNGLVLFAGVVNNP